MREFSNIADFVAHLGVVGAEMAAAEHEGLEEAAQIIEAEAKAETGTYQDRAGQFPAWAELADVTKEDRVRLGFPENEPLLRTGDMRESIEHEVEGSEAQIGSNSDVALAQELGTARIPPRSFLGGAAFRKGGEAASAVGRKVVATLIRGPVDVTDPLLPE